MGLKTPVAFLVFNRPDTTEQVFATIRQAQPETLLVVADGPRPDRRGEEVSCAKVRTIIEQVDWPCRVLKNYSEFNLGCKDRVSSGLEWVFTEVEEAIILEDDCLPHPSFFPFCEKLLERYRDDERVMMIGGTNYLLDRLQISESYFFSRYFPIWGWATWRRSWRKYDIALKGWNRIKKEGQLNSLYPQKFMRNHLTTLFDSAYQGHANTWDIQWFYACLFNSGLSVIPKSNLISNIGLVGTHTESTVVYNNLPVFELDAGSMVHPELVYPNGCYDTEFFNNYSKVALSIKLKHIFKTISKFCGVKKC